MIGGAARNLCFKSLAAPSLAARNGVQIIWTTGARNSKLADLPSAADGRLAGLHDKLAIWGLRVTPDGRAGRAELGTWGAANS